MAATRSKWQEEGRWSNADGDGSADQRAGPKQPIVPRQQPGEQDDLSIGEVTDIGTFLLAAVCGSRTVG